MSQPTQDNPSILSPGQSGGFFYTGNLIPNQVDIQNLSAQSAASYSLRSDGGWSFFGQVDPGVTISITVIWPSGLGEFTNTSSEASILISGFGIRPAGPDGK